VSSELITDVTCMVHEVDAKMAKLKEQLREAGESHEKYSNLIV